MTTNLPAPSEQPAPLPSGPAVAHARNLSVSMGSLAGGTVGALFGYFWGSADAGRGSTVTKVRTAVLAAVGAVAGAILSNRTWTQDPSFTPGKPQLPGMPAGQGHAEKLEADRAVQADTSQAL